METKEYLVQPHRQVRRKIRRRPLTMRERGIPAVARNGQFIVPSDARHSTPFVLAINELIVRIYNDIANAKIQKSQIDAAVFNAATEVDRAFHQKCSDGLSHRIQILRQLGYRYRSYVIGVEGGKPVNEPLNWDRE